MNASPVFFACRPSCLHRRQQQPVWTRSTSPPQNKIEDFDTQHAETLQFHKSTKIDGKNAALFNLQRGTNANCSEPKDGLSLLLNHSPALFLQTNASFGERIPVP